MFSIFSFFTAVIWLNLALLVVAVFSRQTAFLVKHSTALLLWLVGLGVVRALLPLDFKFSYIIQSWRVMPALMSWLKAPVLQTMPTVTVGTLLVGVWILGAAIVLAGTGIRLWREYKARRRYRFTENQQIQDVFARLRLKRATLSISPDVVTPMMTGVFRAHIFLPDITLTDEQWMHVLQHEYQHYVSRDIFVKLFYLLLRAAFWWNPVIHWFDGKLNHLLELRCDEQLTRRMQEEEKEQYLYSLLTVANQLHGKASYAVTTMAFVGAKTGFELKQRFQLVLSEKKANVFVRCAGVALLVVLFIASFLVVVQPAGLPRGNRMETGYDVTPENAYITINQNNEINLYADKDWVATLTEAHLQQEPFCALLIYKEDEN